MNPAKAIKLAVIFSDPHCGSTVGLMPPAFVTGEGETINQNPVQEWLWDCWQRANKSVDAVIGRDPFALILNGDMVDGDHHGTKQIWSKDINDHFRCAEEVFSPMAQRAQAVYVVRGTECHTNNHESGLGRVLGAETNPDSHKKKPIHCFDRLTIDIHGTRCVFAHHISSALRDYTEGSGLSVALNQELTSAARNGEHPPTVVVRSHRHRFSFFGNGHELCFVTPPWQAETRFVHKVVTATRCHPGALILDWRNRDAGELPEFHYKIFNAPQPTVIKV